MIEMLVPKVNERAVREAVASLGLEIEEGTLRETDWTPDTRKLRIRTMSVRDARQILAAGGLSWSFARPRGR